MSALGAAGASVIVCREQENQKSDLTKQTNEMEFYESQSDAGELQVEE